MVTLKQARSRRMLTVRQLAERSGVSAETIFRIERGSTTPRPHVVHRLSDALGLRPEEIDEFSPLAPTLRLRQPTVWAA